MNDIALNVLCRIPRQLRSEYVFTTPSTEQGSQITDIKKSFKTALQKAGIKKVSELVEIPMRELMKIKNFGKKSADEINEKLKQYNLSLKDDIEFDESEVEEE